MEQAASQIQDSRDFDFSGVALAAGILSGGESDSNALERRF
jgi:hypothetical protein